MWQKASNLLYILDRGMCVNKCIKQVTNQIQAPVTGVVIGQVMKRLEHWSVIGFFFFFFFLRLIWTDCATEQFFRTQAVKKWSLSCCCRINQTGGSLSISTSINEAFFGVIPHRMGYDFVSVKVLYQKESLKRKGFASNSTQLLFYYHFSDTHAMLLPEGKKQALIGSVLLLSQWKQSF